MAGVVGDKIYAIGGWIASIGGQDDNHMCDPKLNTWITLTSMITPVSGAGVTALNDNIHIFGGYDGSKNRDSVQISTQVTTVGPCVQRCLILGKSTRLHS